MMFEEVINLRIEKHPILNFPQDRKIIFFTFNGTLVQGYEGDTVASALYALGILKLSESIILKRPRGLYCSIGNCSSCHMIVDGVPNVKTCITLLKEGMVVKTQTNKGEINAL
jgi:aerobic-type carbon monoxide dehydrogenase small subunit (CoxS/CutS family)